MEETNVDRSNTLTTDRTETGWKCVGIINVANAKGQ